MDGCLREGTVQNFSPGLVPKPFCIRNPPLSNLTCIMKLSVIYTPAPPLQHVKQATTGTPPYLVRDSHFFVHFFASSLCCKNANHDLNEGGPGPSGEANHELKAREGTLI